MKGVKVILFIILILFISEFGQAAQVIDFGDWAPAAELTARQTIPLSLASEAVTLELKLEADYLKTDTNQRLGVERIKLETVEGELILSSSPVQVSRNDLQATVDALVLPLTVIGLPIDLPGKYQGQLTIAQLDGEGQIIGLPEVRSILFTVSPWLSIEQINGREIIRADEADYKTGYVFSRGEPVLKVAANTAWKLYGFLEPDNRLQKDCIKLDITAESDYYTELNPEGLYLDDTPQKLIVGEKTTSQDNYWVEIPVKLIIERFTKLKAGQMKFPVNFAVAYFD